MWTLYIIFAIIAAPITLILHEFTHAIVVWRYGGKVLQFKIYPHTYKGQTRLAAIRHATTLPNIHKALEFQCWFYVAPLFKSISLLFLWTLLGCFVHYSFFILAVVEFIDAANWFPRGYYQILWSGPLFDGARFRRFFAVWRALKKYPQMAGDFMQLLREEETAKESKEQILTPLKLCGMVLLLPVQRGVLFWFYFLLQHAQFYAYTNTSRLR